MPTSHRKHTEQKIQDPAQPVDWLPSQPCEGDRLGWDNPEKAPTLEDIVNYCRDKLAAHTEVLRQILDWSKEVDLLFSFIPFASLRALAPMLVPITGKGDAFKLSSYQSLS